MTRNRQTAICRRPDGSIDVDLYARRAASLRRAAMREQPAQWAKGLVRLLATLAFHGAAHRTGRPSPRT